MGGRDVYGLHGLLHPAFYFTLLGAPWPIKLDSLNSETSRASKLYYFRQKGETIMTMIDYIFLAVCVLALAIMLIGSKVVRTILWETLRHPLRSSRIEVDQGQIFVNRSQSVPAESVQPPSPAGAR